MNILTKNRILQKGDEYFEPKGAKGWIPVPKDDYGLQIQFTPYKEVRRPSEKPFPVTVPTNSPSNESHPAPTARKVQTSEGAKREASASTTPPSGDKSLPKGVEAANNPEQTAKCAPSGREPISPDNVATATAAPNVAKAGSDRNPVVSHSATGDTLPNPPEDEDPPFRETANAGNYLPTIVSKKAHKILGETPETVNDARTEVAKSPVSPTPLAATVKAAYDGNGLIKIKFPKPDPTNLIEMSEQPIWTGRNGTFTGYGLEAMRVNNNVMLSPIGKRGVGNCTIQMPLASIDELIEWLKKQTPK